MFIEGKGKSMFILKSLVLLTFIFLMVQNFQSIFKRKRFISYSRYVSYVKQTVNEINTDMVQEVAQMYDEEGEGVDASALIRNLRRLTGILFVLHPVLGAFVYEKSLITVVSFMLSMAYLVGSYCLEQILVGSESKTYFVIDYVTDHIIPILNILIVVLMSIYL